jgi:hypothetical protein
MLEFKGNLYDRSEGEAAYYPPSSKMLMATYPPWPAFIRSITGWARVEPGTLTLDPCWPGPSTALRDLPCLAVEPADLFDGYEDGSYADFLRRWHGERRYYVALAQANNQARIAVVLQQVLPAERNRLEVCSPLYLREALQLETGDPVRVEIFPPAALATLTAALAEGRVRV